MEAFRVRWVFGSCRGLELSGLTPELTLLDAAGANRRWLYALPRHKWASDGGNVRSYVPVAISMLFVCRALLCGGGERIEAKLRLKQ